MVAAITAPVIAALTPALGATGAAFAVNATLYVGVSAASYFIQQAMQPKPETGTKLRAASGGAVSMSMLVGEKESAGSLIYAGSWGKSGKTPNGYYVRVYVLADLPCTAMLERTWGSGNKYTLDLTVTAGDGSGNSMGNPIKELRNKDGNDFGWAKFLDGTQTSADNYLRAHFGSDSKRPWTADMIGRGRAIMIVTERYNKKEPGSLHEFAGVFQGAAKYDWRKDSTNGGSGSHRWGDRSTYEYTANPIVIAYNIMRGIYWGNTWLYGGLNWPARRFDNDTWTAAANVCDENVSLAAGGTEKRYRMGAEIQFSEQPLSVIDRCLAACNGQMVESGGIYKVYAGGIGASVYSFTDDDVIITEGLTGKMFPGREDICNTIAGSYVEPDNGGQMKAYSKRTKVEYVDADGGEVRPREMSFDYVRNNRQAQRLSLHALNDNRRFMTKVVAFPSSARKLEPGDVVNWSSSVRFGFVNKKFIVGDVTLADNGVVLVVLREADASDADWSTSDEATYTVGVYGDIVPATQVISITATPVSIKNNAGANKKPAVKIEWTMDADDVDWKRTRWQVRLKDTGVIVDRGTVDADELQDFAVKGIVRNENYQARAMIIPESDRDTDWCAWINVTAPNVKMDGEDIGVLTNDNIGLLAIEGDNIAGGAVDNPQIAIDAVRTPKIQRGAVTATVWKRDKFRSNVSGGKASHDLFGGKYVKAKNESGSLEFVTITGSMNFAGGVPQGNHKGSSSMSISLQARRDGGGWQGIYSKSFHKSGRSSDVLGASLKLHADLSDVAVAGRPKKNSVVEVKGSITFSYAGTTFGEKATSDITVTISMNRR